MSIIDLENKLYHDSKRIVKVKMIEPESIAKSLLWLQSIVTTIISTWNKKMSKSLFAVNWITRFKASGERIKKFRERDLSFIMKIFAQTVLEWLSSEILSWPCNNSKNQGNPLFRAQVRTQHEFKVIIETFRSIRQSLTSQRKGYNLASLLAAVSLTHNYQSNLNNQVHWHEQVYRVIQLVW